jgi:hypothetical protein
MRFHYIFVDLEFISLFFCLHIKQVGNSLLVIPLSMQIRLSTIDNQY